MIRIRDLSLRPGEKFPQLLRAAAKQLGCTPKDILRLQIVRKSIDARKKQDVRVIYTVDVAVRGEARIRLGRNPKLSRPVYQPYLPPKPAAKPALRPVIAGFGPAGMFAALLLAEAGLRPIILERGYDVDKRQRLVSAFWDGGALDPRCNVQFGEGGAGTFSDGKLNTGIHDARIQYVLQRFVEFGAPENILYDAKPHVGTDVLCRVVKALRTHVCACGAEIRFGTTLTDVRQTAGHLTAVLAEDGHGGFSLPCDTLLLAIGHSARDTFEMLERAGLPMEPKPFSMGVRIEQLQEEISRSQYGAFAPMLPPADYKLNCRLPDGSSAYTFCMCPGGYVVAAASEQGGVVTNGMSYSGRSGINANAALLVTLQPGDFPYEGALGGARWQREIEEAAFLAGGGTYFAPAQLAGDFLAHRPSTVLGRVAPTYRPGVALCDLHNVLPQRITATLEQALPLLDQRLRGFAAPDAVLTAPETRSSSPVRILRSEHLQSPLLAGCYPCGEGAGYAGGITSAAVDGIRCAEAILTASK